MPEVGYAYFDETGIYFDYEENARNDARNILDESRRWFEWRKASPWQRDFATIQEECLLSKYLFHVVPHLYNAPHICTTQPSICTT